MNEHETTLDMVRRHVREGSEHVAAQRVRIVRLRSVDLPTEEAEDILVTFEATQVKHETHLARIMGE